MSRILFVLTSFGCGGINRSLQNLLYFLKKENPLQQYDILVFNPSGQYQNIFDSCEVKTLGKFLELNYSNYHNKKGLSKLKTILVKVINRLFNRFFLNLSLNNAAKKYSKKDYDAIIAFSEGLPTHFVSRINHPNKIAWIHCDYISYLNVSKTSKEFEEFIYNSFSSIINVSEYTNKRFLEIYPKFQKKCFAIHNTMNSEMMIRLSKEKINYDSFINWTGYRILTVGRIDRIKNQISIPSIANQLRNAGINFRWYIIGPNMDNFIYEKLVADIKKLELSKHIFLLGELNNPYPYISKSDLLVNTSLSEACPYVINESKILGTPVICSDFGSVKEFIEIGKEGFYTEQKNLGNIIEYVLTDKFELYYLRKNLIDFKYKNDFIIQSLKDLF